MTTPIAKNTIKVIWEATDDQQLNPLVVEGECVASGKQREPYIQLEKGMYFIQATANTGTEVRITQYAWTPGEKWKLPIVLPPGKVFGTPVTKGAMIPIVTRSWLYPQVSGGYFPPGTTIACTLYPL